MNPIRLHGFVLEREQRIAEIESLARLWRHEATGARLLSLESADENKVFGISFRTPPTDSTGIAHILEHSVLCGSRKYPVKEPFVELLKGSLQTFLNAFTYPDKTCYPVASANLQDFYNLVDVYLDAVFHPRLTPQVLEQEGWHYEVEDGRLVYKGVVMGEMKGAYSSPDALLSEYSQQAVFPNTTYGLDSGGDPRHIPDLTFEAFQEFHRRHYHPSNSYIFFSGDDDPARRLELLDACLRDYQRLEPDADVALQPRLPTPSRVEKFYAAGDDEGCKALVTVNWLLTRTDRAESTLTLAMLDHILVGLPSSPLRKALMDSGLGEDVCGVGLEEELRQMYFSVGLKGLEPADAGRVKPLVLQTLQELAEGGVAADIVEAAVNTVEFELREMNTGRFPRGLSLMLRALTTWLHDGDPLAPLAFEAPLAAIKARLAAGEPVFENLVRSLFLDNPHRAEVVLLPDPQLAQRQEAEERQRLDKIAAMLGPAGMKAAQDNARALKARQQAPDSPEALATIPRLRVADLPRENPAIPRQELAAGGARVLLHDLPTRGIAYLDVGLDLAALPQDFLPCVPLFGRALLEMGTESQDFVALTRRIARKTGGIDAVPFAGAREGGAAPVPWLFLRGKATQDKVPELAAILHDVLLTTRFDDQERFRQMVLEEKARQEERLIPAGHAVVAGRLKAGLSPAGYVAELFGGVENLLYLRRLAEAVDKDWARVLASLEEMRGLLLRRGGLLFNATLPEADYRARLEPELARLAQQFPDRPAGAASLRPKALPGREGLTMPAQVNYVGKAVNLDAMGYKVRGADLVVARFLRNSYLWDRVRVQGGAYGAFCQLDRIAGTMVMASYRDPNVARTLDVFDAMAGHLKTLELTDDELQSSIVGAIGDLDAHQLPDAKGFTSMSRWLQGITADILQEVRDEMLSTTAEDFRRFGRAAALLAERGRVAVLGSPAALGAPELDLALHKVL